MKKVRAVLPFIILLLCSCSQKNNVSPTPVTNIVTPPAVTTQEFQLSQVAEDLITDAEVSATSPQGIDGGHYYYDLHYQTATWPGPGSGATIAIGVDLGQNSAEWTTTSWSPYLSMPQVQRLANCSGDISTSAAKSDVENLQDIVILWDIAINEFDSQEVPNYYSTALRVFPGLDKLSINAQSAVLSVCYNRGFSMTGSSRVDMRNLRDAVAAGDYDAMSAAILHMDVTMYNAWNNAGIYAGMKARRAAEAQLILTPDN